MRRFLSSLSMAILSAVAPATGSEGPPCYLRVTAEFIELAHPLCTQLMQEDTARSGPRLHARVRTLIRKGKARIVETSIVATHPGEKATVESIMEYIYPTENSYGGLCSLGMVGLADPDTLGGFAIPPALRPHTPTAFDTRNVGTTFEIAPNLSKDRRIIDLRLAPELVTLLRHQTWTEHTDEWGAAPIRFPIFESLDISTSIALLDGQFGFVGSLTPSGKDGTRDFSRKVLLFVRADVMEVVDSE